MYYIIIVVGNHADQSRRKTMQNQEIHEQHDKTIDVTNLTVAQMEAILRKFLEERGITLRHEQ
jgi:hypothetical protein